MPEFRLLLFIYYSVWFIFKVIGLMEYREYFYG